MLAPCAAIHTRLHALSIDVVFLDRNGRALRVVHRLKPWRIAVSVKAHTVVELAAGALSGIPSRSAIACFAC